MTRVPLLLLSTGLAVLAQTPTAKPEFEAAEVKLNKSGELRMNASFRPGGEFYSTNAPVIQLIKLAWDVREEAISGAPHWATADRFDVVAKAAALTPVPTAKLMLQTLLEREFKLQTHVEQRPMEVWVMTVAKSGIKIKPDTSAESTCKRREVSQNTAESDCTMTMPDLAKNLLRMAPAYFDREIVDQTGLAGAWNFQLSWVAKNVADDCGGATIFEALDKQAGLRLDLRKIPMPMVVIDHIEKPAGIQ